MLVVVVWAAVYFGLDPWLRRQLEQQVSRQTAGQYALQVGALRTRLADGSVTLTNVQLQPTARFRPGPDSLPKVALRFAELYVSGIDLGALWRQTGQHLDTGRLTGLRLQVEAPARALFRPGPPLHTRLPARVPQVHLAHLLVRDARATYHDPAGTTAAFRRLDLTSHDLQLAAAAAAADSTRLYYARVWQGRLRGAHGRFGHHRGRVAEVALDSETGVATVDSLRVRPVGLAPPGAAHLRLQIGRARLTGWHLQALRQRQFRADSLRVAALRFDLTPPATPPPPLHQLVGAVFTRFRLADARLTDGYVRLRGLAHAPVVVRAVALHAEDLRVEAAAYHDPHRVWYAAAWAGSTGAAAVRVEPPFYRISYERLAFATRPGTLRLTNVRLAPQLSVAETARRKAHAVTLLTVRVPEVRLDGGDFGAFGRTGALRAGEIVLANPRAFIDGDSRYPIDPHESVVTPEAVRKIPFPLDFRRITVVNGRLDFRFIGTVSPRYGTGRVTHLNVAVTNVTNDPARMTATTPAVARATAVFQGQCRARATVRLNLLDPRGRHYLTGTFGAAPAHILNSILEPAALTRIQTGTVQRIDVQMTADRTGIRGELRGAYQNLHIRLLNDAVAQTWWTKIKSKAANKLVVHDDNPAQPGEALRVGRIAARRERRYSVFALWKQGVVSGALHSIGVGAEKAQKMSETQTEPGAAGAGAGGAAGKEAASSAEAPPARGLKKMVKKLLPGARKQ